MYLFRLLRGQIYRSYLFISYVNDGRVIPKALSELPDSSPTAFTRKTGQKQKEEDIAVLKGHLTRSNLLFVQHFTHQNKGNLFHFLIWRYIFNLCLRKRDIAQDSLPGRVLIIFTEPVGKKVKMTREKLYFKVRKYTKWKAIIL